MKEVPHTDALKARLVSVLGDPQADISDLAVFEAVAVNTRPLLRRTGLHASARIGHDVLADMAQKAMTGTRTIPLHSMHRDSSLPLGRVFSASVHPHADGNAELRSMFYLPRRQNSEMVSKLNSGIINEVSVGIQPSKMLCSACGWDYAGDDCTFENVWDCTCPNDHTVGKDSTHLKMHGSADWQELSMVGRGAADGALILPRPKQTGAAMRLNASGFDRNLLALYASAEPAPTLPAPSKEPAKMSEYIEKYVTLSSETAVVKAELTTLKAAMTAKDVEGVSKAAEIVTLKASITDLTTKLTAAQAVDGVKAAAELADAQKFMDELVTASLAATGKAGTALPETVSAKVALLRECRASLALVIPAGGSASNTGKGEETAPTSHAAFKRA